MNSQIKHGTDIDMNPVEQKNCQQRSQKGSGVITDAFKAECASPVRLRDRRGDQRIARRRARACAEAVQQSAAEHCRPGGSKAHKGFASGCEKITNERHGLMPLKPIRESPSKALHDVLRGLGKAVDQTDDAAACLECLREKHRQNRIKHFRRNIGEQTGTREKERVPRKADKVTLKCRAAHRASASREREARSAKCADDDDHAAAARARP